MGVRGLNTYIADRSTLYLKPYELCDTYLIIDGKCIAYQLYLSYCNNYGIFGGDYDEYYKVVKKFFSKLLQCNVTPFVLLDGGHEEKKLKTIYNRGKEKVLGLKLISNGFYSNKFTPIFLSSTFVSVLNDLNILCMRCDYEADGEIATIAKALNCPVLSFDSDFFIYDVVYIPFSTVNITPVEKKSSEKEKIKYYMQCSVFEVTNFLNAHDGFDKSLLPILVTLLGNDYVDSSIFHKFFDHVIMGKNKNASFTQRKIQGVINWLKKENFETAKAGILKHLRKIDAPKVLRAINQSISDYDSAFLSSPVYTQVSQILEIKKIDGSFLKEKKSNINLPIPLSNSYSKAHIPSFVMDLITLGSYYTHFQIEDIRSSSSHFVSLDLIQAISVILHKYSVKKSNKFKLYACFKGMYCPILVENIFTEFLSNINLDEVLILPKSSRAELLYKIVDFDEDDIITVESFPSDWSIFLISYVYWIKSMDLSITQAHIYSLFFMAVANKVVQKRTGYYENSSAFMKSNKNFLNENNGTTIKVNNDLKSFTEMVNSLKKYECLLFQKLLIPLRNDDKNNYK
ncbi:conserved hypothetical protein [Pediculus humanus corporis]|uniref:XPG N-terminal domain-containing protein n=1 Tax=Pediculus humanus subsp. corporis TaxID=121224 RepID=E0VND4_PEDHC|nr:uncharacterized protein Phum_PHUM625790 [Pediculus humanus corporis]EEB14890.1 conserved hypothetical protein [Pediculus humanus corporis]